MESSPKYGCTIRNQKDPYQIQCVFLTDPDEKRDFSVYFNSLDGSQELMVSCTRSERDECIVLHEGLTVTDDYITVSETFSKQAGSFVCRNGGPPLEQFPCFYSGNSVNSEGTIENETSTFRMRKDVRPEDYNLAVIFCGVLGVVVILQSLALCFLLVKNYKSKKERKASRSPAVMFIGDVCTTDIPLLVDKNKASSINQNAIDEETNSFKGKGDKHYDLSHLPGRCISKENDKDPEGFEDPAPKEYKGGSLSEAAHGWFLESIRIVLT